MSRVNLGYNFKNKIKFQMKKIKWWKIVKKNNKKKLHHSSFAVRKKKHKIRNPDIFKKLEAFDEIRLSNYIINKIWQILF